MEKTTSKIFDSVKIKMYYERKRWRSWTMSKIFDSVKIKMFTNKDGKNREVVVENFRYCRTLIKCHSTNQDGTDREVGRYRKFWISAIRGLNAFHHSFVRIDRDFHFFRERKKKEDCWILGRELIKFATSRRFSRSISFANNGGHRSLRWSIGWKLQRSFVEWNDKTLKKLAGPGYRIGLIVKSSEDALFQVFRLKVPPGVILSSFCPVKCSVDGHLCSCRLRRLIGWRSLSRERGGDLEKDNSRVSRVWEGKKKKKVSNLNIAFPFTKERIYINY